MTPHIVTLTFRKHYAPLLTRTLIRMVIVDAASSAFAELKARAYAKRCYKDLELLSVKVKLVVFVDDVASI